MFSIGDFVTIKLPGTEFDGLQGVIVETFGVDLYGVYNAKVDTFYVASTDLVKTYELTVFPVCECGAEKVSSSQHSNWCAKHA